MSFSKTIIHGHLGQDPELRYSKDQVAVCNMSVATDHIVRGEKETEWHKIITFGKTAEAVAKYLKKGSGVLVEGHNRTQKWEDKDGNTRYTTEIIAEKVDFTGGAKTDAPAAEPEQQAA